MPESELTTALKELISLVRDIAESLNSLASMQVAILQKQMLDWEPVDFSPEPENVNGGQEAAESEEITNA